MGIIRKTFSLGTLGAVDLRSDKERTARSARQTKNAVEEQTRQQAAYYAAEQAQAQRHQAALLAQQAAYQQAMLRQGAQAYQAAPRQPQAPSGPPPGWYVAASQDRMQWWDGFSWTAHYQPLGSS